MRTAGLLTFLRRHLRPPRGDDGFSLMEIMVGAGIMVFVTAISAQGFITMYRTVNRTDGAVNAQYALMAAFNKLDHEVRYAKRVNSEGTTAATWSVTYVLPQEDGTDDCVQLTLPRTGGALLRREWTKPGAYSTAPTATYVQVAANLLPAAYAQSGETTTTPLLVTALAPASGKNFDTLRLSVAGSIGVGTNNLKKFYDVTFTALNTQSSATPGLKCLSAS
jgi:Tfp pilus assembly protein PilW